MDIGISDQQRQQIAEGLGQMLADSYVLYSKTHGFHGQKRYFNTHHKKIRCRPVRGRPAAESTVTGAAS